MVDRVINKALAGVEDLLLGTGTVNQTRNGVTVAIKKIDAASLVYENSETLRARFGLCSQVVDDRAALTALPSTVEELYVYIRGLESAGDGGGGLFYNNRSTSSSIDGVNNITASVGRWERVEQADYFATTLGNSNANLNIEFKPGKYFVNNPFTADRTYTLLGTFQNNYRIAFYRSQANAFTLTITDGSQSFTLNDNGYIELVYFSGAWHELINTTTTEEATDFNGSFELDTNNDDVPDNWVIAPLPSGTIAIDDTSQAHGKNSLKFTSAGSGGGSATSSIFEVLKGGNLRVMWEYIASVATALQKVEVLTYDKDLVPLSVIPVWSEGTAASTAWRSEYADITVDATAVYAAIRLTGVDGAGTSIGSGVNASFDNVRYVVGVIPGKFTQIYESHGERGVELFSQTTTCPTTSYSSTWTRHTITQLANTGAKYALLRCRAKGNGQLGGNSSGAVHVEQVDAHPGLGTNSYYGTNVAAVSIEAEGHTGQHDGGDTNTDTVIVKLNDAYQFDYIMSHGLSCGSGYVNTKVSLVGYWT